MQVAAIKKTGNGRRTGITYALSGIAIIFVFILLITCTEPARAGSGVVTKKDNGNVVDMTIYFHDTAQPRSTWTKTLTETSKKLWIATHGLLRLGKIRYSDETLAKGRADIVVGKDGHARVDCDPKRERTSLGSPDTVLLFEEDNNDAIVCLHEFGHYFFTLSDEYLSQLWEKKDGKSVLIDENDEEESFCSVDTETLSATVTNPNHSCFMYNNHEPDTYYMFCGNEHLLRNDLADGKWCITYQTIDHQGKSCRKVACEFFGITDFPAQVTGNPPDQPSFIDLKPDARFSIFVQADLYGTELATAKKHAISEVRHMRLPGTPEGTSSGTTRDGDSVGVSTFDSSVTDITSDWVELKGQAEMDSVVEKINEIETKKATINLDEALKKEMKSIVGSGYDFCLRKIILYTNGPGTVSESTIDELRRNDVVVDVIEVGRSSNSVNLKNICSKTGGKYTPKYSASKWWYFSKEERAAEPEGGFTIASNSGILKPGSPITHSLPIDSLCNEAIIDFNCDNGGELTLTLKDPNGTSINIAKPPTGVTVLESATQIQVRIKKPSAGNWVASVSGESAQPYSLDLSGSGAAMGESEIGDQNIKYPQATLLQMRVENENGVTGCQVQAVVTHPNGTKVTLPMYDDGDLAFHGDRKANDGLYTALFTQYTESGNYLVEYSIKCLNGFYTDDEIGVDLLPGDPPPGIIGPAPIFQRIVNDSFILENVPAGGGTALLTPGKLTLESENPGQAIVKWVDTNSGKAGTAIMRYSQSTNSYKEIATVNAGKTEYIDSDAGTTGQANYKIVARTTAGDSSASEPEVIDMEKASSNSSSPSAPSAENNGVFGGSDDGGSSGFCFIATAAYGSPFEPHVTILRAFRDRFLLTNKPGILFVKLYYAYSPYLANIIAPSPILRAGARHMLEPVILTVAYPWLSALLVFLSLIPGIIIYIKSAKRCPVRK